jgi:hypothetical protein
MHCVHHRGLVIALDHPALWFDKGEQIVRDLVDLLTHPDISLACLRHLIAHHRRLVGGAFRTADGRGCLVHLLTEQWPPHRQVRSKHDLVALFGRAHGKPGTPSYIAPQNSPEYQPVKWLVRLVDGQICRRVRARYGRAAQFFDPELLLAVVRQVLDQRSAVESSLPAPQVHEHAHGGRGRGTRSMTV